MQLPKIAPQGSAGSLGREDPRQSARDASLPFQAASDLAGNITEVADYQLEVKERASSAEKGNRAIDESKRLEDLLKQPSINIDDPRISDKVRNMGLKKIANDPQKFTYADDQGNVTIPTYYVADELYKETLKGLQKEAGNFSSAREASFYQQYVGGKVSANMEKALQESNLQTNRYAARLYDDQIDYSIANGDLDNGLDVIDQAFSAGIYTQEKADEETKAVVSEIRDQNDYAINQQTEDFYSAIVEGDAEVIEGSMGLLNETISQAASYGDILYTKEEINEKRRVIHVGADQELARRQLITTFKEKGFVAAQDQLTSEQLNQKVPEGWTASEKNKFFNDEMQTMLNKFNSANNAVESAMDKGIQGLAAQSMLGAYAASGNTIYGNKGLEKAQNRNFEAIMLNAQMNGATPEMMNNIAIDQVRQYGYIPEQVSTTLSNAKYVNNPEAMLGAVNLYNSLANDPDTFRYLDQLDVADKDLVFLQQMSTALPFYDGDQAAFIQDRVKSFYSPKDNAVRKANYESNRENFKELRSDFTKMVEGGFVFGLGGDDATATTEAFVEYEVIVRDLVEQTGDYEASKVIAFDRLKGLYGSTKTDPAHPNGKFTKNPIEKAGDFAEPQYKKWRDKAFGENKDSIYLESFGETDSQGNPVWSVMMRNPQGDSVQAINEQGQQMVYQPDIKQTEDYKLYQQQQKSDMESVDGMLALQDDFRDSFNKAFTKTIEQDPMLYNGYTDIMGDSNIEPIIKSYQEKMRNNDLFYDNKVVKDSEDEYGKPKMVKVLNKERFNTVNEMLNKIAAQEKDRIIAETKATRTKRAKDRVERNRPILERNKPQGKTNAGKTIPL